MTHASHDPSTLPDPVPDAEPQATGPRSEPSPALAARKSPGKVRWGIAILLFLLVLINYFDRTNISVIEGAMREEFGLSGGQMGIILSSFLWSYTLMQIPAGLLLDRFGVKRIVRIATWLWALACVLTALAGGTGLIIIARVILGFGESPVFPGAMKATGYWFSRAERGVATAIFDSGQRLSNVIGTPLVALVVVAWGWRAAFWATAALSIVFAIAWWILYRDPKRAHAEGRLSEGELACIREGGAQDEDQVSPNPLASLVYILGRRTMWGLAIGLACAGYTQWMLLTWLPGYLQSALHMDLASAGFLTAVP
ncbi:MFS transporter [Brachybacterium nesterenkovii]|uniref:MFS transporter n=1 Tax=Brachybacterium nesterenkovii TaxID=47847 RepID=UPI0032197FE5